MSLRQPWLTWASVVSCALAVAGCGRGAGGVAEAPAAGSPPSLESSKPVSGDWLRYAYTTDPQTLNFVRAQDRLGTSLSLLIGDPLVAYDSQGQIVPRLAESWSFSPDGLVLTFHLRSGVRWHDGSPVTSEDAAYTIEKIRDPRSQAVSKYAGFAAVESVETPDPSTLLVRYREPFAPALGAFASMPLIPKHLYESEPDFLNNPQCRAPIGCGPFRFVSWSPGQEVVLEANEDYWDGRPYLDRLVFKIIPQDSTRLQALGLGEIDATALTPQQLVVEATGHEFQSRFRTTTWKALYVWYVGWNMDGSNAFFTDRRVRQAMTLAIDRPGYVRTVWYDMAVLAASFIPPASWGYAPEVKAYPYDPERARGLLDEAGWKDTDGDGVRDRAGVPFTFTLLYPATGQTNDQMAEFFQENLRQVGVRMNLQRMDYSTLLERQRKHRFDAFMGGSSMDVDPDISDMVHSTAAENGTNYVCYSNPEVDRLCEAGRRTLARDRRKPIYARIQQILSDDQPYTFVFHSTGIVAVDRRFHGVELSPVGVFGFWPGVSRWWVPREEQRLGP